MHLGLREIFMIHLLFYIVLWLISEYAAFLFSIIMTSIGTGILAISLVVELIEPTRVPKKYFAFMAVFIITPIIVGVIFTTLYGSSFDWMSNE